MKITNLNSGITAPSISFNISKYMDGGVSSACKISMQTSLPNMSFFVYLSTTSDPGPPVPPSTSWANFPAAITRVGARNLNATNGTEVNPGGRGGALFYYEDLILFSSATSSIGMMVISDQNSFMDIGILRITFNNNFQVNASIPGRSVFSSRTITIADFP